MRISSPSGERGLSVSRVFSSSSVKRSQKLERDGERTVGRNDSESCTKQRDRLLDSGVALGLVQAVAARLVERAEGVRVEACDVVLAAERVVLEDLVGSVHGAAADDAESAKVARQSYKTRSRGSGLY